MDGRTRVLGPGNGPLSARLLFIAEAPGRLGADVTGVPLSGDRTGQIFNDLLAGAGIARSEVFVTNAVLCNPRDDVGRNERPTIGEIRNCREHLARLMAILDPVWVVTLGTVALEAVADVAPHALVLQRDVGHPIRWHGRWLVPLYHPGPRALIRRPLAQQRADYRALAKLITTTEST
jgi:uracil-DNA glycosylase family 4